MADQDSDAKGGLWTDPALGRETFAAVASEWQESETRNAAPKTRVGHDSILRAHVLPAFGQRRIAAIDARDIQKWVNQLADAREPSTVHNVFAVLRMVMDFAVRRNRIAVSPCSSVKLPPKRGRRMEPLTHEQVARAAAAMPTEEARAAVVIAAYMGLRAGELWALRRNDINLLKRALRVHEAIKEVTARQSVVLPAGYTRLTPSLIIGPTKTYAERTLSIPGFLVDAVATLIPANAAPDAFLFADGYGRPIRHNNFYKRVFLASLPGDLAGTRWHDLRHTCASLLIDAAREQGMRDRNLVAFNIKEYLGHKNIQTTLDIYSRLLPSGHEAMAASLDAGWRAAQTTPSGASVRELRP